MDRSQESLQRISKNWATYNALQIQSHFRMSTSRAKKAQERISQKHEQLYAPESGFEILLKAAKLRWGEYFLEVFYSPHQYIDVLFCSSLIPMLLCERKFILFDSRILGMTISWPSIIVMEGQINHEPYIFVKFPGQQQYPGNRSETEFVHKSKSFCSCCHGEQWVRN